MKQVVQVVDALGSDQKFKHVVLLAKSSLMSTRP